MKYEYILVRYGELTTKGKNRNKFLRNLRELVNHKLRDFPETKLETTRDRMYVQLNGQNHEPVIKKLQEVFGLHSFSLALKAKTEVEDIQKVALDALIAAEGKKETFKVVAHRAYKQFPLDTFGINREVGGYILQNYEEPIKVDVHNPDITVRVEVRAEATYIMCGEYKGLGGLPVGAGGKALLMLSGGIDSPVAGYSMLRRGVTLEAIHFFSPPYTSERSKEKVLDLTQELTKYCKRIKVHIIPFTELQKAIYKEVPSDYTMTVMRRMMLRIAERVATDRKCIAIANGENLGQVASQTLDSMYTINEVTNMPILRPLLTMDKLEIISIAEQINTYDISIRPYEDCCTIFSVTNPATKPKREKVNRYEAKFDFEPYIEEIMNNIETVMITEGVKQTEDEFQDLF